MILHTLHRFSPARSIRYEVNTDWFDSRVAVLNEGISKHLISMDETSFSRF